MQIIKVFSSSANKSFTSNLILSSFNFFLNDYKSFLIKINIIYININGINNFVHLFGIIY